MNLWGSDWSASTAYSASLRSVTDPPQKWMAPKEQHLRLNSVLRLQMHVHAHTYTPHSHLYTHTNAHTEREITQLESKHLKIITKLNLTLKIRKMNKIVTD